MHDSAMQTDYDVIEFQDIFPKDDFFGIVGFRP